MNYIISILVTIISISSFSCSIATKSKSSTKKTPGKEIILDFTSGPQTIIYKTKKDYSTLIPISLSEDKSTINSYPHPKDIFFNGELAYPTKLENGYLLDNRGINLNVAFINITYEDYSKIEDLPSLDWFYSKILDQNPLIELYYCGNRNTFKNEIEDINKLINNEGLKNCKCLTKE